MNEITQSESKHIKEYEDVTLNVESGFGLFGSILVLISYILIACTVPFSLFASFKVRSTSQVLFVNAHLYFS